MHNVYEQLRQLLPDAPLKFYLDAAPEVRAQRRWLEEQARGGQRSFDEVLAEVRRRDQIDSTRAVAPLRPAADALIIDSTHLSVQRVVDEMIRQLDAKGLAILGR